MCNIKFIKSSDKEFADVKKIRQSVFVVEQGAKPLQEFDSFDSSSYTDYCIVLCDNKIVGTGRLVNIDNSFKIGRIAILKEYRGKHLGDLLVNSLIDKAKGYGAKKLFVDAQIHAIPFYEKIGFEVCGGDIIDRGIVHRQMKKELEK